MEQWEKNYYISSVAGSVNGSSLVVMSKGECHVNCKFSFFVLRSLRACYAESSQVFRWCSWANFPCLHLARHGATKGRGASPQLLTV